MQYRRYVCLTVLNAAVGCRSDIAVDLRQQRTAHSARSVPDY